MTPTHLSTIALTALTIGMAVLCSSQKIQAQDTLRFDEIRKEIEEAYSNHPTKDLYKQYKRLEYYLEYRTNPDGTLPNIAEKRMQVFEKMQVPRWQSPASNRAYSGDWTFAGPVNVEENKGMGRVNKIDFHPSDPEIIYAATAGGGLWYTPNHGIVWYPLTQDIPVNNLQGVAVNYNDPDTIYILTGDGDGASSSFSVGYSLSKSSIGVLRTTNGGGLWTPTGLSFAETAVVLPFDLKMHPTNPNILFASTNKGLFKTTDAGATWDTLVASLIYEIEFHNSDPETIFAVDNDNFYRSTNGGLTWPDTVVVPEIDSNAQRMGIETCPSNDDVLYLIASPSMDSFPVHRGFFRSDNGGTSFAMQSDTPNILKKSDEAGSQANYDLAIECDPATSASVIVGTVGLWKSTDNGATFVNKPGTHADIHELKANPINGWLYAATDGGVYYSEDFGESWNFISEWLRITQYYRIAVSQMDGNVIIGGTQDNGTNRNENGDLLFDKIYHKDGMDCAVHPLNDDLMIYSAQGGEFFISTNGGDSEQPLIFADSLPGAKGVWVTPVAWDPVNPANIYIGYDPIYRSNDGGATFAPIPDTVSGRRLLHAGQSNPDRLYAADRYIAADGKGTSHFWSSQDGGDSWSTCHFNAGFPDTTLMLSSITTNPDNSAEVWITCGGWKAGEKVYRSLNAGFSWSNMTGSLPNVPVNAIIFQDTDGAPDNAVYIGTDVGVFYRDDALGDWIYFSNGLPVVEVTDLEIQYNEDHLVAATFGRGIWKSDLFSGCKNAYNLPDAEYFTGHSYFYQAGHHINSAAVVDGIGSSVIYKAGNYILLEDGFRALSQNGAFFKAIHGPCTGGVELIQDDAPPAIVK